MVLLDPSAKTVCRGDFIVFNCSAYSNPEVHTYELYVNGTMVNETSRMGIWNITIATGGVFDYKCIVNNTIGTAMSMDVAVTVNGKKGSFCNSKLCQRKEKKTKKHYTVCCHNNFESEKGLCTFGKLTFPTSKLAWDLNKKVQVTLGLMKTKKHM